MNEGTQRIDTYKQRHARDLKVAAEDASGIGKGFHKGTTDTKMEDVYMRN